MVHSQNQGKSCVTCSLFANLLVLSWGPPRPKVRLDPCLVLFDAVGLVSFLGSSGLTVQGALPSAGSCYRGVVMCCAFLCFGPSCCWWPCKEAFVKDQRAEVAQVGKGNAGAGSQHGRGLCWPQGWPWGTPHSQDSSFPVLETCCAVYFDFPCVQMYVFTIVRGRGNVWLWCSKQNCIFCL